MVDFAGRTNTLLITGVMVGRARCEMIGADDRPADGSRGFGSVANSFENVFEGDIRAVENGTGDW